MGEEVARGKREKEKAMYEGRDHPKGEAGKRRGEGK